MIIFWLFIIFSSFTFADDPWLLAKVKSKGPFLSKDRFLQHYTLEPGEPFDEPKHAHSLAKITQEMHNEGYLMAQVQEERA